MLSLNQRSATATDRSAKATHRSVPPADRSPKATHRSALPADRSAKALAERFLLLALLSTCAGWTIVDARQSAAPRETGIRFMRDSEEYATLTRQLYRLAGEAVARSAATMNGSTWAVVLDIDETALDNSTYQLERAAYDLPFEAMSWSAWVRRRQAPAVPGAAAFVAATRRLGGRVAWISNRDTATADATRENMRAVGLWDDRDLLCAQTDPQHTKAQRRHELVTGTGACAWPGVAIQVAAFVGDQLGDFPSASEQIPHTGTDDAFGRVQFLLPNAMYGDWTSRVTRIP